MPFDRRTLIRASAAFGALALGSASAQASGRAKQAQPQRRPTTMMGRQDRQLLMSKITVSNLVRSYRFYTQVIGLQLASPQMAAPAETDEELEFREYPLNFTGSLADPFFVLVKRRGVSPTPETAALVTVGFKTPDSRAVLERAAQAGYTAGRRDPGEGAMSFAFINDPDGYQIELVQAPSYPA